MGARVVLAGSTTAIWQRKDRGGRRQLAVCLVLELSSAQPLTSELACSFLALLLALLRMQHEVSCTWAGVGAGKERRGPVRHREHGVSSGLRLVSVGLRCVFVPTILSPGPARGPRSDHKLCLLG